MDQTDPVTMMLGMTLLALVLCLPLIWYIVHIWRPLQVKSGATRLSRGWTLTHVTGVVLWSRQHSRTTVTAQYDDYGYGGGYRTVTTDVFDDLTLRQANGLETNVQVVNFNVSAAPGHVVSFWTAQKRGQVFTFAVLNHTTNQQNVNQQQIFKIMLRPALQIVLVFYLCFLALPIVFMSVFGGMGVPLVIFFVLLILFAIGQKRVRRQFGKKGLAAIWKRSRQEAEPLLQWR